MHFEMISDMLLEMLDEKTIKNDPPNSSQEMMRVLPEQVNFHLIVKLCLIKAEFTLNLVSHLGY